VTFRLLVGALVTGATALGCDALNDMNRTGGNSDKGYFQIEPECHLAQGAHLDFTVGDYESIAGSVSGIDLTEPEAKDASIVKVVDFDRDGGLKLEGLDAGETRIAFTADADGDTLEDSFAVKVVEVTKLSFLPCATDASYVRGEQVKLSYRFNASAKKDVLGLGYYPFTISPKSALTLNEGSSTVEFFSFLVDSDASDSVVLASSLSGDDTALVLTIVDEDEFDAVVPVDTSTITTGSSLQLDLRPQVNGRTVCSQVRRVVRSAYPGVCSIVGGTNGELETTESVAQIRFEMAGVCELYVEFPGADLEFFLGSTIVTDPPSGGSSGGDGDWD
jgi:hypothetical protein